MFVTCSMQSLKLHIAPVNTLLCFASGHRCSNQSLFQGFRGQNCGGTVQRRCGSHHPGHPRGAALHLHLRGSCQTQGIEQENNVYQGHPAAQPGLLLAQVWGGGAGERGARERSRKGCCCVLPSPLCSVSGKLSSLSRWQRHSRWRGYGWDLEGEGCAINPVPLVQNAIASSFVVVPILLFNQHFFTLFFSSLINSC